MKVVKRKKEEGADWQEITMDQAVEELEGSGHWRPNTVKEMLKNGDLLWTTESEYKIDRGGL